MTKYKHGYPPNLLLHIGRVAIATAFIEQEFVLWASALYSQSTGGKPTEHLRMSFSRLLNKWWAEAQKRLDAKVIKSIRPIYDDLRQMWPMRNIIIHGTWHPDGRSHYRINLWEQHKTLERKRLDLTIGDLGRIASAFERALGQLYRHFDQAAPASSPRKSRGRRKASPPRRRANPAKR